MKDFRTVRKVAKKAALPTLLVGAVGVASTSAYSFWKPDGSHDGKR